MRTRRQRIKMRYLKALVIIINGLLVVQYLLGMVLNLFVNIPFDTIDIKSNSFMDKTGIAFGYARTSSIISLQLHWLNASILIVASLLLLVLGIRAHKLPVWIAALALTFLFSAATISSAAFIAYSGNNYYSFSMATAFIVASIIAVSLLFYLFLRKNVRFPADSSQLLDSPQKKVLQ